MRFQKETAALAAAVASIFAGPIAAAEGPRYTYAEIGYGETDFDNVGSFEVDGDGFRLGGSVALNDSWHLFASYDDQEIDVDGGEGLSGSVDYTELAIGGGFNHGITDATDLVIRLAYVDADLEFIDDNGYALSAGVRSMVLPKLELNAGITYSDIGDFEDDTSFDVGGVFNFTDMFAVTAGASFGDDITQYGVGVRAYFGQP